MSDSTLQGISSRMLKALHDRSMEDWLSVEQYVECALYTPGVGYYTNPERTRIGRTAETDFYTARSNSPLLCELVAEAARKKWGEAFCSEATFHELGVEKQEPAPSVTGFKDTVTSSYGEADKIRGKAVLFSNELFDAQPFQKWCFTDGEWQEMGIALENLHSDQSCKPACLPRKHQADPPDALSSLTMPEGYVVDWPSGANRLIKTICQSPWTGWLVAVDYGKDLQDLLNHFPEGTARTYSRHRQNPNLFQAPGQQDITHHVCWTELEKILAEHGFVDISTTRLESFLLHETGEACREIIESSTDEPNKRHLMELLHPAYFGAKFQVLSAWR